MTDTEPATDWGQLYRDHVDALAALAGTLTDEQLGTVVVATPEWTVRQVFAHLAGGPADSINDRTDGAPGPAWTARHVAERDDVAVPDLLAEIRANTDAVAASVVDNPVPAVVWDMAVHHADLHEGLGLGPVPERFWAPVLAMVGPMRAPALVDVVDPYELFRGVFSRRSRAQMAAWGADLSGADLDAVCIFGPRDDDQPLPG